MEKSFVLMLDNLRWTLNFIKQKMYVHELWEIFPISSLKGPIVGAMPDFLAGGMIQ